MSGPLRTSDNKIDPSAIAASTLGAITAAIFGGFADVIRTAFNYFLLKPIQKVTELITTQINRSMEVITTGVDTSFAQTAAFVGDWGPLAWIVGLALTLMTAYMINIAAGLRNG